MASSAARSIRASPGPESKARAGEGSHFRRLLAFGGWVSVAQVTGPLLLVLERVIVSKRVTNRPKDLAALPALEATMAAKTDPDHDT